MAYNYELYVFCRYKVKQGFHNLDTIVFGNWDQCQNVGLYNNHRDIYPMSCLSLSLLVFKFQQLGFNILSSYSSTFRFYPLHCKQIQRNL